MKINGVKNLFKNIISSLNKSSRITSRQILSVFAMYSICFFLVSSVQVPYGNCEETKPLKIGVPLPLSGGYSSLGKNAVRGMSTIFEQHDWKIAGRPIELVQEDTEYNPQVALRKARKLVESDQVDFLLGVISSSVAYAMKEFCAREKVIWMGVACAADGIFKKVNFSPYTFRSSPSTTQISSPMGDWLVKKGYKRVFLAGPDYAMGREMNKAFKEGWLAAGGPPPIGELYTPIDTKDFAPYLTQIKMANPDCVYAPFAGSDSVRFVKQYEEFGLKKSIQLTGMGYLVEEDTVPAQGDSAVGIFTTIGSAYGLETPENKKFIQYYKERYNSIPSVDDYSAACAAMAYYEALRKLKGNTSDKLALSKALQEVSFLSPRGPFSFDPVTNNVICNMYIRESRKADGAIHNYVVETYKDLVHPHE